MRRGLIVTIIAAAAAFGCADSDDSPTGPTFTVPVTFSHAADHGVARLSGGEEVPQRETQAAGLAIFHVSNDGQSVGYTLRVSNIRNVNQAHIHVAPAGSNGGIVAWLFPSTAPGAGPSGAGAFNGTIAAGVITSANLLGAFAGQPMSALLDAMRAGNTYVNVHTNDGVAPADTGPGDFPGGEVRGQIR